MTTSARTLTPEQQAALQKLQSFQQQRALDQYLSERATQYGTTPKGAKADTGWTAGETLANPFAGLTDFGKKTTPIYGTDEQASNVIGEEEQAKTASDLFREKFGEQLGHKTSFVKAYKKDEKGNTTEVNMDELTPGELNSGNVVIYMGGKTGGTERERMAQAYIPKGDKLIPVGDPSYYKGEHPDAQNVANALKIASIASLPFGGIGGVLSNIAGTAAAGAGTGIAGYLAGAGIPSALANIGANALVSGVIQGGIGSLTGQGFGKGFRSGALSGGVGAGLGELGTFTGLDKSLGSLYTPAKSLATSGVTSLLTGQKFDLGQAAKGAATNYLLNEAINTGGKALEVDPKQQAALMKFLNFAAPMISARRKPGG